MSSQALKFYTLDNIMNMLEGISIPDLGFFSKPNLIKQHLCSELKEIWDPLQPGGIVIAK